jgi:hypothetical protein
MVWLRLTVGMTLMVLRVQNILTRGNNVWTKADFGGENFNMDLVLTEEHLYYLTFLMEV